MCNNIDKINFCFLLKILHRKGIDHSINQWKSKYVSRISSTLIDKFDSKPILFHIFPQAVDKRKQGRKIKKLKSEKPKEDRETTLLPEPGFDLGTCPGNKIKKWKSKKTKEGM